MVEARFFCDAKKYTGTKIALLSYISSFLKRTRIEKKKPCGRNSKAVVCPVFLVPVVVVSRHSYVSGKLVMLEKASSRSLEFIQAFSAPWDCCFPLLYTRSLNLLFTESDHDRR